jgi:hypothetical protein
LAERALVIIEADRSPGHPDVAICLANLAVILRDDGDLPGARLLLDRALAVTEAALGSDHPNMVVQLNNLAVVLADLGDTAQARSLVERAIDITDTVMSPDHPHSVSLRARLADLQPSNESAEAPGGRDT